MEIIWKAEYAFNHNNSRTNRLITLKNYIMEKVFGIILLGVGINIAYSWISCSRKTSWTLFVFTALLSLGLDCFNGFSPIETFSNGVTYLMTKSIVILALMYFLYLLHYLLTEKAEWFKPSEKTKSSLNLMRLLFLRLYSAALIAESF